MEPMDEATRQRFEQATRELKAATVLKQIDALLENKSVEPIVIRDMSICWAFIASAVAEIEGAMQLMPDTVVETLHIPVVRDILAGIRDALQANLDRYTGTEES